MTGVWREVRKDRPEREASSATTQPAWAVVALGRKLSLSDRTELLMLREFFLFWCELHALPRTKENRKKQEAAAENMVRAADTVKRFQGRELHG